MLTCVRILGRGDHTIERFVMRRFDVGLIAGLPPRSGNVMPT